MSARAEGLVRSLLDTVRDPSSDSGGEEVALAPAAYGLHARGTAGSAREEEEDDDRVDALLAASLQHLL